MNCVSGQNNRNESTIEFVTDEIDNYTSLIDFYAAALRILMHGWESCIETEKYIATRTPTPRTTADLQHNVNECLQITPVPDFSPEIVSPTHIYSFRDGWNAKEFVWAYSSQYYFMRWYTSA